MLAVPGSVSADHSYDVALSYLREEHADDARELATRLRKAGYSVFFDEFEEAELWGQVLEEKLESIYRDEARFCVMFVSAGYIARPWTRHERRVAIARAVRETGYVLPIRYDDSDIPGLPDGVVYRDRRKDSLDTIFGHLVKKLGPPRVPQAKPATAAIQVFPADYVGVVVEKDKASRPILNIRCHVLNAGREAATLSRLEVRLEDPDGSSIRMPWNLFYSGMLLMLPESPPGAGHPAAGPEPYHRDPVLRPALDRRVLLVHGNVPPGVPRMAARKRCSRRGIPGAPGRRPLDRRVVAALDAGERRRMGSRRRSPQRGRHPADAASGRLRSLATCPDSRPAWS